MPSRPELSPHRLSSVAAQLVEIPGIVAVTLGGSRARGDAQPDSDVDLGLYYRPPLDTAALRDLAGSIAETRAGTGGRPDVTEPGDWGPWVDGGGWLEVDGVPVDWIYRDLDRVQRSVESALIGRFELHAQTGHPFGVPDVAYAGELAVGVVLADPTGELARTRERLAAYPPALRRAVVDRLDEARFLLGALTKSAGRSDTAYVAGCLFRVVTLCAHAVCARAGRWVTNEKGIVDAAGRLPTAPADFALRAHGVLAHLGREPDQLRTALADAASLVDDTAAGTAG